MDLISLALRLKFRLNPLTADDWTVVVAGIGIVLGTLFVLILVFYVFGAVVSGLTNKAAAKKNEKKQVLPPAPVPPMPVMPKAPAVEQGISGEVVAAISAAVYSMEGSDATITSIKPVRRQNPITARNPWANAGVIDNTRPF